jgi:magnesium chelatase subunit I
MNPYDHLVRHNGNRDLFCALEMSVIAQANHNPFHIHVEGLRGTGKTTILRAARQILPPIVRIKNCLYNCRPDAPHCPQHRHLTAMQIKALGMETVPRPFLEISHSAKVGTVVGSIDIGKLTDRNQPSAALLPGTIPQAHRGIIFVDEINRLADTSPELADVLLDVMGTKPGRIQIEETGLPTVDMDVSVSIWAASNPDEDPGSLLQIRKQLSDRFDVMVSMGRPDSYQAVQSILNQGAEGDLACFARKVPAGGQFEKVQMEARLKEIVAAIYVDFGLESLRAAKAMVLAARLEALFSARTKVEIDDLIKVVPLVLGHRTDHDTIAKVIRYLKNLQANQPYAMWCQTEKSIETQTGKSIKRAWWKLCLDCLRKKLAAGGGEPLKGNFPSGYGPEQNSAGFADPAAAHVAAPPVKALPLRQLPEDQLIKVEAEK